MPRSDSPSGIARAIRFVAGPRGKIAFLLVWGALLVGFGALATKLPDAEKNDSLSWLPGSAESTQVLHLQGAFQPPNTLSAVVVFERSSGLTADDHAQIAADIAKFKALGSLPAAALTPQFSADGKAASVVVPFDIGKDDFSRARQLANSIRAVAAADPRGLSAHVTGTLGNAADSAKAFAGVEGALLYAALAVVIVILLLTYRSPVLWLLPVMSAGAALLVTQGCVYLLAAHAGLTVNAQSAGILTVLVFGAGTDYALLLVARYREELRDHKDHHEAMATALHRAGPAIAASAGTVAIGLLCLMFAETNSTSGLGPVSAIAVAVTLLAMITLLPAILVIVGRWVFWPAVPRYGTPRDTLGGAWGRVGSIIARRPRPVWALTTLFLAVLGLAALTLHAHGLTNAQSFRGTPDSVTGEQVLARHFPAGAGSPVIVITNNSAAATVRRGLASTPGIASVLPAETAGNKAYLEAVLVPAPDSNAALDVVKHARETVHAIPGADAKIGGVTAIRLDGQRSAAHDRTVIIPIVLGIVFLILALLLRAILGAILLIATVVLAFLAALGVSALVFNHLLEFGGADASLPLFAFVFLVALGIDYNIFLMTRVREETLRHGPRTGPLIGLAATGGVISSAGLVLAGTFAVLATIPVIAFAEIGFVVAVGVLIDTFIVRSVLVTSLTLDLGRRFWWPARRVREETPPSEPVYFARYR